MSGALLKSINNARCGGQLAVLVAAVVAAASPAAADAKRHRATLFNGDFDTGRLNQWHVQRAAGSRVRIVRRPRTEGRFAARFRVAPGDVVNPGSGSGHRAEVYTRGAEEHFPDRQGAVRYYGWCSYLPRKYPSIDKWQLISQWKNKGSGQAPIFLRLQRHHGYLMAENEDHRSTGTVWSGPMAPGRWHSFVLRVKYGPTPRTGSIAFWSDGVQVLQRTPRATMLFDRINGGGLPNYWKLGLYRSGDIDVRQTIYHDGAFVGRTKRSVARC
jgi:hypothetical protein